MAKGPRKHLKRINAPHNWMLDKMGGVFAPRPREGPHKLRESIPLALILRNKLHYANNYRELKAVLHQRLVKIDSKVREDLKFPVGFMDVVEIEPTNDRFRVLYDSNGRFVLHRIAKEESEYKLCKVQKKVLRTKGVPVIDTHDGRRIRYADPEIKVQDTVKIHLKSGKISRVIKFEKGNLCYVTTGANRGRIGEIINIERHPGSFTIVGIKDARGGTFSTRADSVFVIGQRRKSLITLPADKGIKLTAVEHRRHILAINEKSKKKRAVIEETVQPVEDSGEALETKDEQDEQDEQ